MARAVELDLRLVGELLATHPTPEDRISALLAVPSGCSW
jgi:hypothetical protein